MRYLIRSDNFAIAITHCHPADKQITILRKCAHFSVSLVHFQIVSYVQVSRSFAVVIQQLPETLQDPVCIFYLVLRGLDSVEDDMTFDVSKKIPLLQTFHEKLYDRSWSIENVGDSPDYRILLAHFQRVIRVFLSLDEGYQKVIADITRRMGVGMSEYATEVTSIATCKSYDLYCHYVAGLVGHGLSSLFAASGLEDASLAHKEKLSNSMGLFLQKTNIIRDYLEDLQEGRTWWPEEIWSQHVPSLDTLAKEPRAPRSLACLNHMVTDALSLVPDSLEYLSLLKNRRIFEFCAIPQVMAMATLELCYNNIRILEQTSVKIRKGLSCKLMLHASNNAQVHGWFHAFANRIGRRIPKNDPNAMRTRALVDETKRLTQGSVDKMLLGPGKLGPIGLQVATLTAWGVIVGAGVYTATRNTAAQEKLANQARTVAIRYTPLKWQSHVNRRAIDALIATTGLTGAAFLGGWLGMQFV
jgi:farnesyl-diphosphate farnesyltransferase